MSEDDAELLRALKIALETVPPKFRSMVIGAIKDEKAKATLNKYLKSLNKG